MGDVYEKIITFIFRYYNINADVWIKGYPAWHWADGFFSIEKYENGIVTAGTPSYYGIKKDMPVYFCNILSKLDNENEFFLDRKEGKLYFYSDNISELTNLELSFRDSPFFIIENCSNITISGITFRNNRNSDISIFASNHIKVEDCDFLNSGRDSVVIKNSSAEQGVLEPETLSEYISVNNCLFKNCGAGGVNIEAGDRTNLIRSNSRIVNCTFSNFSRLNRTYAPGVKMTGIGIAVENCKFFDAPHSAIIYQGNDMFIEGNDISSVCYETSDCGAIYTGRDWTTRGNKFQKNYIHDLIKGDGLGTYAVYLDDMSSSTNVSFNIFKDIGNSVFLLGGGRDNCFKHNLIINTSQRWHVDDRGLTWGKASAQPGGTHYQRLNDVPWNSANWLNAYPDLKNLMKRNPGRPEGNVISSNIIIGNSTQSLVGKAFFLTTRRLNLKYPDFKKAGMHMKEDGSFIFNKKSWVVKRLKDCPVYNYKEIVKNSGVQRD